LFFGAMWASNLSSEIPSVFGRFYTKRALCGLGTTCDPPFEREPRPENALRELVRGHDGILLTREGRCMSYGLFCLILLGGILINGGAVRAAETPQIPIPRVELMPRLPTPLSIRDWNATSRAYYEWILDPAAVGDSFPAVRIPGGPVDALPSPEGARRWNGFEVKSYLGSAYADEAFTCLGAVIGARLAGLDLHNLHGVDYVDRCKAWYDPHSGLYRHHAGDHSGVVPSGIYGYWPAIQGMMLAAQYPKDPDFTHQALTAVTSFHKLAHGMGCPEHPDFANLGWDFDREAQGGRPEPMNRFGNAPAVAWMLMAGAALTHDADMLACARSALNWYVAHPGRYEMTHAMGPVTAARLNVQGGPPIDMDRMLAAWFGDGDPGRHPWRVTAGTDFDGLTCDGLDGARWGDEGFYAFTMGSLEGPAWLIPVVRYDPRYARAIGRYALNAANSLRLLQGEGLDSGHQDHAAWKARWDPQNLLFYEGLQSWSPDPARTYRPYATGDPVLNGWGVGSGRIAPTDYLRQRKEQFGATCRNISLYMGNHIGFLGGIVRGTDVPGILTWDCVATDWFHRPAYPTQLIYNPYPDTRTVTLAVGKAPVDFYHLVRGRRIAAGAKGAYALRLPADTAAVLVAIPAGIPLTQKDGRLVAGGVVVDWRSR
jgi:hypothetical protein